MKFFTKTQLEHIYGKSFDTISPTDTPKDIFRSTNSITHCQNCNTELTTTCTRGSTGHQETAYCTDCHIKHTRDRRPLITQNTISDHTPTTDSVNYQYAPYRTDEREEYICPDCKTRHPFTIPTTNFTTPTITIHSHDQTTLNCRCGARLTISDSELPLEIDCPDCPRNYNFTIQ